MSPRAATNSAERSPVSWKRVLLITAALALVAGPLAAVFQRDGQAAWNVQTPLPGAFLIGDETGQAAFGGSDILASSLGDPTVSIYRFSGTAWNKVSDINLVTSLGLVAQPGASIDGISADGGTATVTVTNGTESRQVVITRNGEGVWAVSDAFPVMSGARLSGGAIAGMRGAWVEVTWRQWGAWQSARLATGNLRDIDGPWIAMTSAGIDEIWHLTNGRWERSQQLGPRSDGMLLDGNQLVRSTGDGVTETWVLEGNTWQLANTQTINWGAVTHFESGGLLVQTTPAGQVSPSAGSFYEQGADGTWIWRYSDQRLAGPPRTSNPSINADWILGVDVVRPQRAAYSRNPDFSPPTTLPTTTLPTTTTRPTSTTTSASGVPTTTRPSSSTIPPTSTTTRPTSTTTWPPGTSTTTRPSSTNASCAGITSLDAQGSFVPSASWSVLPQYLNQSDETARMVATHLTCQSGRVNESAATVVFKFQNLKFTANDFTRVESRFGETVVSGTGTIGGDSTLYRFELTIRDKSDTRDATDYYKIKLFAPGQTTPTVVVKGPVRGHKITTEGSGAAVS